MAYQTRESCAALLEKIWYGAHPLRYPLLPLSALTAAAVSIRRNWYARVKPTSLPLPVIVVGGLTVGGTGKTPLVIAIARYLDKAGYRPGIASRGYGGRCKKYPHRVNNKDNPDIVGDEPLLIRHKSACPVAVDPDRSRAIVCLKKQNDIDVAICDDGLQHYRLHRDVEIAVVNGRAPFGNGLLLPAGPLREPRARLEKTDFVVTNGSVPAEKESDARWFSMRMQPVAFENLTTGERRGCESFSGWEAHACAGIARPQRFFDTLDGLGIKVLPHAYPDHHRYRRRDLDFAQPSPIMLTEKDAVKCRSFANADTWVLRTEAVLEERFWSALRDRLRSVKTENEQKST